MRCTGAELSAAGLLGGASRRPGEASLAGRGVLILDDLALLRRTTRQALCGLLDRREAGSFWLVATLRPCPCGGLARPDTACGCPPAVLRRHQARIDGALLDRLDLYVEVPALGRRELARTGEASAAAAARVAEACRFRGARGAGRPTDALDTAERSLLTAAMERLGLSARALDRALGISRTIADLAGSPEVRLPHLAEAIQYRRPAAAPRRPPESP